MDYREKMTLLQFEGFETDKFLDAYLQKINPSKFDIRDYEPYIPMADNLLKWGKITEEEYKEKKEYERKLDEGVPKRDKKGIATKAGTIIPKVLYLQDVLIRRSYVNKDSLGTCRLSADKLKKVIGDEYKELLLTFVSQGFIRYGITKGTENEQETGYVSGETSRPYTLIVDDFKELEVSDQTQIRVIRGYKEKMRALVAIDRKKVEDAIRQSYGDRFLNDYKVSLNKIKVSDEAGLDDYIKTMLKRKPKAFPFYNYVKTSLNEKKDIYYKDPQGRMYHLFTHIPRGVKKFLSIDFAIDCRNSHPLLFNAYIFWYHDIDRSESATISEGLKLCGQRLAGKPYEQQRRSLRKTLKATILENHNLTVKIEDFKIDELFYVYLTTNGLFWDYILGQHPELGSDAEARSALKVNMFAQVIYAKSVKGLSEKPYAQEFKRHFPRVYSLICSWKHRHLTGEPKSFLKYIGIKVQEYDLTDQLEYSLWVQSDDRSQLSKALMAIEAQIYTSVLSKMYSKRWRAFHIHDCIVVPQSDSTNHPTWDKVEELMRKEYLAFGLVPTFSKE